MLTQVALDNLNSKKDDNYHSPEAQRFQEENLTNSNIGIANAKNELNKMFETNEAHKIIKADGTEVAIETLPGVPVYCKVNIIPPGPYNIFCKYADKGEFLIATSIFSKTKFPDKKKSQQLKNRPEQVEIDFSRHPHADCFYFSTESQNQSTIYVRVINNSQKNRNAPPNETKKSIVAHLTSRVAQKKDEIDTRNVEDISDGSYFEEVRKLNKVEEERRQEKFLRINDDNVANAQYWNQVKSYQTSQLSKANQAKLTVGIAKKEKMLNEKRESALKGLVKWEEFRQLKEKVVGEHLSVKCKMAGLRKLLILAHLVILMRYITRVHKKVVRDVRKKRRDKHSCNLIIGEIHGLLMRRYGGCT